MNTNLIAFNIIYENYKNLLPDDSRDYYHVYEYLYNKWTDQISSVKSNNSSTITSEIIAYFELGIQEHIFKKLEIFQMIKISPSFFKSQILKSDIIESNADILLILEFLSYLNKEITNQSTKVMNMLHYDLLQQDRTFKEQTNEILKNRFNSLESRVEDLEAKIYMLESINKGKKL